MFKTMYFKNKHGDPLFLYMCIYAHNFNYTHNSLNTVYRTVFQILVKQGKGQSTFGQGILTFVVSFVEYYMKMV